MPITKTAKRALRSSEKKAKVNKNIFAAMEIAIRTAKKSKKAVDITKAFSKIDRAVKKKLIHKNKAARQKSMLSKLLPKTSRKKAKSNPTKKPAKK